MAITTSAKKAHRASLSRRVFNDRRIEGVRDITKKIKKLLLEKKKGEAARLLPDVYKAIDKAAKGNTIKKNTASRKKSRLTIMVNRG